MIAFFLSTMALVFSLFCVAGYFFTTFFLYIAGKIIEADDDVWEEDEDDSFEVVSQRLCSWKMLTTFSYLLVLAFYHLYLISISRPDEIIHCIFGFGIMIMRGFTFFSASLLIYFIIYAADDYVLLIAASAATLESLSLLGVARLRIRDAYDPTIKTSYENKK